MKRKYLPYLVMLIFFTGFISLQLASSLFAAPGKSNISNNSKIEAKLSGFNPIFPDGKKFAYEQNGKILIINFWASWCSPCLKELPSLLELYAKNKEKIQVIGINSDADEKNQKRIEDMYKISFTSIRDPDLKWLDYFGYQQIPTTIIFKNGKMVYLSEEFTDFSKLDIGKF